MVDWRCEAEYKESQIIYMVHHINNFKLYNVACEALNYTPILFEDMINEI